MNRISVRPKPTRQPQTLESLHGCVTPPHWRASMRQVTDPMRIIVPSGSRLPSFSLSGFFVDSLTGSSMKRYVRIMDIAPIAAREMISTRH